MKAIFLILALLPLALGAEIQQILDGKQMFLQKSFIFI